MRKRSRRQVTIPEEASELAGLLPHADVVAECIVEVAENSHINTHEDQSRGARLVAQLRGRGDGSLSTDEILALTRGE